MYTLKEKIDAMYDSETMDRFTAEIEEARDRGDFELPDNYGDLTAEDIVTIANSAKRDTFIDVLRENLRQNVAMDVEYLEETMWQIQEAYDDLDEEDREIYIHTVTIGTEAAIKMWEDNAESFKKLIGELPADERAALITNGADNAAYLRSDRVPPCIKPWAKLIAIMWQSVHNLAA